MLSKHHAGKLFTDIISGSKVILILFLVVFSYITHSTEHICAHPKQFMTESILLGLSSAISVSVLGFRRGQDVPGIINLALLFFLVMFFYNFMAEMSGEHGEEPSTLERIKGSKPFKIVAGIILGILALVLGYLALIVRDSHKGDLLEAFIFAVPTAGTMVYISKNHDKQDLTKIFIKNFLMFFIGYYILQYGGFNRHVFEKQK
jgi:Na+/H+ antiporter NhaD/arsenite permease-like protein